MNDQRWANTAISACIDIGADHFFLAPGSRCTPLTLAVARAKNATVVQHFDERGLAFAALGFGRAAGRPGVFICTSGTAVANAFPAVIEAAMESVPMVLLTADRPPELRGTGANQTIDQQNIFGNYPVVFQEISSPEDLDENSLTQSLSRGLAATQQGPVHFNLMFREPFTISEEPSHEAVFDFDFEPQPTSVASKGSIEVKGNVLIALGRASVEQASQALKLADRLGCPILSDVTSGLRTGSFELPTEFDLPVPDTILHLGGRIVSKTWHAWAAKLRDENTKFIHASPCGQNINPNHLPIEQHQISLDQLNEAISGPTCSEEFRLVWQQAADQRIAVVTQQLVVAELSEPAVACFISQNCPSSSGLFLGNSSPIRDADWFGVKSKEGDHPRHVAANRGASGIDGLLATAAGYAAGLQASTTVVLGDLSALHDLNSLSLIAKSKWPLIVVILNNQAGHIFDLLPISDSPYFEQYFATPHSYQFEPAAKMFGLDYREIKSMNEFTASYEWALQQDRSLVLEVRTDRQTNLAVRNRIKSEIAKCRAS